MPKSLSSDIILIRIAWHNLQKKLCLTLKSGQALALSASDADRVLRTVLAQAEVRFTISSGKPGSADAGVAVSGARVHAGAAVLTGALAQARVDGSSLEELKMKI